MTALESYKQVCRKYLILSNDEYIDVVFGVILANRTDSKPVWLYLVGPPGSGKTEVLQSLDGSPEIICRSVVTRPSLISGYLGAKDKDPSLIPQLNGKNLIIKDFTAMLQMRYDSLMETLGLLRDAYDGRCSWSFGGKKTRNYVSKFGCIAAVTDAIDQHQSVLSSLGERFLTYRMPPVSDIEKRQRSQKAMNGHHVSHQEADLRHAAHSVLTTTPIIPRMPALVRDQIVSVAQLVARARCHVRRDRRTREPEIPIPEIPTRPAKQLADLTLGITMARGKTSITTAEIKLIRRIALHAITRKRLLLLRIMLTTWPDWIPTETILDTLPFGEKAIRESLQDLVLLSLAERKAVETGRNLKKTFRWRLKHGQMLKTILT